MKGRVRMRGMGFVVFCVVLVAGGASASNHYVVVGERQTVIGPLVKTETTVQVNGDPRDRFVMTRVVLAKPSQPIRRAVLLVPGQALNFDSFELSDNNDYTTGLAGYLASNFIDVYGYTPRSAHLKAGDCESGSFDCSQFRDWNMAEELEDLAYIRSRLRQFHPLRKPVIGGYSLGAAVAFAALNREPSEYSGAIILDGAIFTSDLESQAGNAAQCSRLQAQLDSGTYYDGSTFVLLKDLTRKQATSPDEPSPYAIRDIPEGTPYRQMYVELLTAELPTPRYGFREAAGSVVENRFYYADEARLANLILHFNDYDILPILKDFHCALSGEDKTHTANLASFTGPVLSIWSEEGFGDAQRHSVKLLGSTSIKSHELEYHGHFDLFARPKHQDVSKWVLDWLVSTAFTK